MLPAPTLPARSLADVSKEFVQGLGSDTPMGSPRAPQRAIVVIDGLGAELIQRYSGHAGFLSAGLREHGEVVWSGIPSTTASALASITTGVSAGQHGLLGYQVRDPASGVIVNHLKPYPEAVEPAAWQPCPTFFETLSKEGVASIAVGEERFEGTDFTQSILRGAQYVGSRSIDGHLQAYRTFFERHDRGLAYLYWPLVDRMGHQRGVDSAAWIDALEEVDGFVRSLRGLMGPQEEVLILADHGMVDTDRADQWLMPEHHPLRQAIAQWAGEPRCVHLYLHDPQEAEVIREELQRELVAVATVLTRSQSIQKGLFGAMNSAHHDRVGDLVVLAEGTHALYDERTASANSLAMVGQHGSWTQAETRVPAIRLRGVAS